MVDEVHHGPKPTLEKAAISPEILEKYSKEDIQLGKDMVIKGEGEERKIVITLPSDDPSYLEYLNDIKESMALARKTANPLGRSDNETLATFLEMKEMKKRRLNDNAFSSRIAKWAENNERDLLRGVNTDESVTQLAKKVNNFNDLRRYTTYLFENHALEVSLPEQQVGQRQPH